MALAAEKGRDGCMWNEGLDATYMPGFLPPAVADAAFRALTGLEWGRDRLRIFGREQPAPRLSAWYGDAGVIYRYSGVAHAARPWPAVIAELRTRIAAHTGKSFNFVLANLYRNGGDSMGWHADDEAALGATPVIASLSFGAERRLRFRRRGRAGASRAIDLALGSLLVMWGRSQRDWQHALPKAKHVDGLRINLTFRRIHG
jgi:alkylated DNA repair dioxygenase AlkB